METVVVAAWAAASVFVLWVALANAWLVRRRPTELASDPYASQDHPA